VVWISFNPELDTDETYLRFVVHPPPNAFMVESTFEDNRWLSKELNDERLYDFATKPKDDYERLSRPASCASVSCAYFGGSSD
jgi:phage terminase large subunit